METLKTYICRLTFTSYVHFGGQGPQGLVDHADSLFADTIFSALCTSAAQIGLIDILLEETNNERFIISDGFPYNKKGLYLPKPYLPPNYEKELETDDLKSIKKLDWILLENLEEIIENNFVVSDSLLEKPTFGEEVIHTKNKVIVNDDTEVFDVGAFSYDEGAGIYFIIQTTEAFIDSLTKILENLSYLGIGGKRSVGYGQFQFKLQEHLDLNKSLNKEGDRYLLLTTSKQKDHIENFDQAYYGLVKRAGFYLPHIKEGNAARKQTQFFFKSGSSFVEPFKGALYEVSFNKDQIYRYSFPLFLGVDYHD